MLFHIKNDDLQRTNHEYLEDETSRNWIPVGPGIYDTGTGKYYTRSGKMHYRNKIN